MKFEKEITKESIISSVEFEWIKSGNLAKKSKISNRLKKFKNMNNTEKFMQKMNGFIDILIEDNLAEIFNKVFDKIEKEMVYNFYNGD